MTILDFLYLSLAIGFLILVAFISFLVIKLSQTLTSLKYLIENVDDTANDVKNLKNLVKGGTMTAIGTITQLLFKKRG